jgi:hypothetical protein
VCVDLWMTVSWCLCNVHCGIKSMCSCNCSLTIIYHFLHRIHCLLWKKKHK